MGKISDIITPVAGLVGGVVQGKMQRKTDAQNAQQNFQYGLKMADYQQSKNIEQWNMQNAYNSPESQMERFKAAGLNPNLIYSQGNAGNAQSISTYQAPTYKQDYKPIVDVPTALQLYQDFRVKQAQIDNLEAMRNRTESETGILNEKWEIDKGYYGYNA